MQYTTHYNLNLPEGTDIVNPLVQDNPNYSTIDAAMFANKQAVIGSATEIVSGTVHAITRLNTDSDYFRFTATGNWTSGDSMSVDGVNVSVFLSDGTTPATGAYIINTEVFALLSGSRVTLITSASVIGAASDITYDNSVSGLTANNVQDAIDELAPKGSVSITADGVKTYETLLNDLYVLIDATKINIKSKLKIGSTIFNPYSLSVSEYRFTNCAANASNIFISNIGIKSSNSLRYESTGTSVSDISGSAPGSGTIIEIIY